MKTNTSTKFKIKGCSIFFLPIKTRIPLKFGKETLTEVECIRVKLVLQDKTGKTAEGWGETLLSVNWVWPSDVSWNERLNALKDFCRKIAKTLPDLDYAGHSFEMGHFFIQEQLPALLKRANTLRKSANQQAIPYLASLVCFSAFDIALHDAYGNLMNMPVYETYKPPFMRYDLSHYLVPDEKSKISFKNKFPADFFALPPPNELISWHLVGEKDPLSENELTGNEPQDGYPVLLSDWIKRDGLLCLKIKLRGNDYDWDYARIIKVGKIAIEEKVLWLSLDFNCTVQDPAYVNGILDKLLKDEPRIYSMLLYIEQPFPYELEEYQIDVHSVAARKPLFMDESAHDWRLIKLGRTLGWSGVALKTCKTQTGALLSMCWAKAHGMTLMVQDLTNPMIAQIPHCLLAAYSGTIMGVETDSMQFYPEASKPEAVYHPALYERRKGVIKLGTIQGSGFGYGIEYIHRTLPPADSSYGL